MRAVAQLERRAGGDAVEQGRDVGRLERLGQRSPGAWARETRSAGLPARSGRARPATRNRPLSAASLRATVVGAWPRCRQRRRAKRRRSRVVDGGGLEAAAPSPRRRSSASVRRVGAPRLRGRGARGADRGRSARGRRRQAVASLGPRGRVLHRHGHGSGRHAASAHRGRGPRDEPAAAPVAPGPGPGRRVDHVVRGDAQADARDLHRRPDTSTRRPPRLPARAGLGGGPDRRRSGRPAAERPDATTPLRRCRSGVPTGTCG